MTIETCTVGQQVLGSDNECVLAEMKFTVESGGKKFPGVVSVKQVVGTQYEEQAMEVSAPATGYQGPKLNHQALTQAVTALYHNLIGANGRIIQARFSQNMTIASSYVHVNHPVDIELADE